MTLDCHLWVEPDALGRAVLRPMTRRRAPASRPEPARLAVVKRASPAVDNLASGFLHDAMNPLRLAKVDPATFLADPRDRVAVQEGWAFWQLGDTLGGNLSFGVGRAADIPANEPLFAAIVARGATNKTYVCDLSRVSLARTDLEVMWQASQVNVRLKADIERRVARIGLLVPPSPSASLLAGMVALFGPTRVAIKVATSHDALASWLGPEIPWAAIQSRLAALVPELEVPNKLRDALRAVLADAPNLHLEEAARRLATSSRTLRRTLLRAGTSFREEQLRARIRHASALLAAGAGRLTEIAARVGFRSLERFATRFQELTGTAPRDPHDEG